MDKRQSNHGAMPYSAYNRAYLLNLVKACVTHTPFLFIVRYQLCYAHISSLFTHISIVFQSPHCDFRTCDSHAP